MGHILRYIEKYFDFLFENRSTRSEIYKDLVLQSFIRPFRCTGVHKRTYERTFRYPTRSRVSTFGFSNRNRYSWVQLYVLYECFMTLNTFLQSCGRSRIIYSHLRSC